MNRPTSPASMPSTSATGHASGAAGSTTLAGRLPSMSAADASLSRVAHDARFAEWLRSTLQHAGIGIARQRQAMPWRLTIESAPGRFRLGLDAVDSPALQLACAHQPRDTACAVVTLLLAGWAEAFAPMLGALRVVDIAPLTDAEADADTDEDGTPRLAPLILGGAMPVALLDADPAVLERVAATAAASGVDLTPLASLPLRPVIRLFARAFPLSVLRGLRPGDTVLAGGQPALLRCGVGRALRASLHIDPQEFTVHLAEPPALSDDPAAYDAGQMDAPMSGASTEAPQSAGTLDELQLPVAFELDTARVSLGELASMQPGYAVELDVPLREATVRLVCHGRTLGQGQLIAIGDHLGVRITRLEFAHDAAAAR